MLRKGSRIHQKDLAHALVDNSLSGNRKSAGEVLESVGVSKSTAVHQPRRTILAKGVQKEIETLGFTSHNAKRIVGSILNSPVIYEMVTPSNQLDAAKEVFKVTGEYAQGEEANKTLIINITSETAERYGILPASEPKDNSEGQA